MIQIRRSSVVTTMGIAALAAFPFAVSAATLTYNGCTGFTFEADGSITCVTSTPPSPPAGAPTGCTVTPPSVLPGSYQPVVPHRRRSVAAGWGGHEHRLVAFGSAGHFSPATPVEHRGQPCVLAYSGSVCAGQPRAPRSAITLRLRPAASTDNRKLR